MKIRKNLTESDVHVNRALTNLSLGFMQDMNGFVAERVFPIVPVSHQSDVYYTYDREFWNRNEMSVRAPATESKGTSYGLSTDSYFADVYALHHDVADQIRGNADAAIQPDRDATMLLTMQAKLNREIDFATNYMATGVWSENNAGASNISTPSAAWSGGGGQPIEDVRILSKIIKETTGIRPNTLVLGTGTADILLDHPDVVDRIKYGNTSGMASVDLSELGALLKIPRVFVMDAVQNTAGENLTESNDFIAGENALLLCYSAPNPGLMTPSAGYTFQWTGMQGSIGGQRVMKFRMPHLKADRIEIEDAFDSKLVSADLGAYVVDVTA